ncbi:MAG TPA: DUF6544 family protein, partial [Anaeromyxobacter sp.]|nr:DUF6544 family protein [Anaeromyxobacter sp.]
GPAVTEADLAPLPVAARRYLAFMGVVGRPRDTSFLLHVRGRFRPDLRRGWIACEAWQYTSAPDVARLFHMRLRLAGVPMYGRDLYFRGAGRLVIRPLDLFTVVDGRGPEYDASELVTYLNDAVLFAPAMLLAPGVSFASVDDRTFDLRLEDRGTAVKARVHLDARGAPLDFETTDRFTRNPFQPGQPLVRARWTTPVDGWQVLDGRPLPTGGRAVWHLPEGELPYVEFRFAPGAIAFGVAPGALAGRRAG